MENKLRRGLALLMTLIMLISCAPMDALAAIVPVSGGTQTSSGVSLKSIVKPPVATTTYVFMNGTEEFARQILKDGQTLNNPGTPDAGSPNKEFVGWFDESGNQLTFPITASVGSASSTVTVNARFADVYFVFFTNEKGEVMVTKKGANGDTISTEGVTYPVGNEQSIVGWKDASGDLVSSVTLNGSDVTLTARVENGHWITYDSQGGTYVAPAFVKADSTTTAPTPPTRPGYTFKHWSETKGGDAAFTFGQKLDKKLTLYAVWTANTNTRYTVIHWLENADDDEYSYREEETKTGTTGAQTSAAAKSYTGFTAQTITQQTIAGDGSTIVNVGYKRNVYEVKFYQRSSGRWQEIPSLKITAKYEAYIGDKWPTYNGSSMWSTNSSYSDWYGLQGPYQVNIETMPLNGAKFYGPKTGSNSESAHYYVEVLPGESGTTVSGVTYKLHHTDTSPGTGYTVTVEDQYPITGFTFNSSPSTSTGSNYNNAKFYYTRNSYNIVYVSGGQTVNTASKKFEESIADAGSFTPTVKPTGQEDYIFGGWYADPAGEQAYTFTGKTMPAQNITVYAKWNKPIVNGTAHITIDGTDTGTTLENVTYGGTITNQLNTLQAMIMQDKDGYTWRGWRTAANGEGEPFNVDTKIYSDITLYPYYTKDGTFTVKYVTGKNDVTAPVDGKFYAEDSFADLMSPGKLVAADGEYFLGWSDGAATYQPRDKYQIKSNHANKENVIILTAQWGARPAGTTLTYKANGGAGADVVENLANNATVTTKPANTFSRVGYTFKGWDTDPKGEGSIAPNTQVQVDNNGGENVLYAICTANTDTKYTVEFYYQNTDGSYPQKANESVVRNDGTTDTTVSVKDSDKLPQDGGKYVFDESNANNVLSGVVAGDGSLVLKLYFKLNTASYTIHHYLNGTTVKVANDQTGAKTIGETLTANKSDALYAAYTAAEVADYAPFQKITINATGNVITVYYTVPLSITAEDANKTYDGQPLTQPDFTMEGLVNGDTKENFTLSMTAESTITNAGSTPNVINTDTVKYNGGAIPSYYNVSYKPGTLTVNKASATVTITGVNETAVYDGKQHEANGYNYSFTGKPGQITISPKPNVLAIARRTDVGTTYMGLKEDSFTVTSDNYNVTIKAVIDGYVTITPVTDKVTVTVTENGAIVTYDGNEHSVKGYKSMTADNKLYDVTKSVKATETAAWTAKGTNAGEYPVGVAAGDFENINKNFTNVAFKIVDDVLKINPITAEVIVTVTENGATVTYDGTEHSVKGYKSMTADNTLYDVATSVKATETDAWTAKGTNAGEYPVGIAAGDFKNTNPNFTNVEFVIVDGKLTISPITDKVTVTITETNKTITYDGSEHSISGYTFIEADNRLYNLNKVAETRTDAWTAKGTDAGEYPVGIEANDFKNNDANFTNVEFVIVDGKLTISPITDKTITITANSGTKVYDGTPLTDALYNYTEGVLVNGDVLTAVVEGSQTDAGSSVNTVTSYKVMRGDKDVTGNYTFGESVMGTLTVSPRPVTITAQDYTVEYDGQPHGKNPTTAYVVAPAAQNSGLVNGHTESNVNIAFTATDAGTYTDKLVIDKTAVTIVDSNNKNVTGNYAIELEPGTLTIEQHKGEVIVTIKGNTQQFTYDCTKHTVQGFTATVNNSLYNVNTDFKYDGNLYEAATLLAVAEGTNVGVYHMNLLSNHCVNLNKNFANVTFRVQDGSLAIERQYLAIEVDNSSKVYGAADPAFADATLRFYNKTGVIIEPSADMKQELSGIDLTVHRADAGDNTIGTHVDVLTISKTAEELNKIYTNYEIGVDKGDFEITSTEESLKVRADNYEGAYDGDGHGVVAKAYINGTVEAPNAVIRYYNEVTGKFDLTESPKFIDVKSATPGERTYTVRFQATLDGLTAEGSANVLIAPRKLVLSSGTESKDYDGLPLTSQEVVIIEGSIIKGQIYDLKATGSVTTVAEGMVKNTITYSTTDEFKPVNYEIEQKPGMLQIEKRDVSLTSETASKEYDGTPLTRENVTVERNGFVAGEVTDLRATGSVTYVDQGEVTNTITFTPTDKFDENNYSITKQEGKLSITKREGEGKTITVTAANDEKVYDGTPLTNNGYTHAGVLADGDELTAVVKGSATNVGDEGKNVVMSYVVKRGDVDVTGNYTFGNSIDGKLTINKRTVNLTSETASKEYDGKPLTKPVVTVTGNGFVTGEVSDIKATGSATFVDDGKVTNAITYTEGENFKETNYTISKEEGKLSITKRGGEGKTITVTANSDEKVYDGAPLTNNGFTHAGALVEGDELTAVVEGSQTDVGSSNNVVKSYRVMRGETDVTNNYTFGESIIGTLTVTPVAIELTAGSDSKPYDGTPLTKNDYKITKGAFVGDEGLASVTVEGSQTEVGSSDNTITGHTLKANTLNDNYAITYSKGTLTVSASTKELKVIANSNSWMYDGQQHADGGYTVTYGDETYTVKAGESATLSTGDKVTAVIEKQVKLVSDTKTGNNEIVTLTIENANQYANVVTEAGTLTITRKPLTITADSDDKEYDGTPLTKDSYTNSELVKDETIESVTITGSITQVGSVDNVPSAAVIKAGSEDVTANYDITYVPGKLIISASTKELKVIANSNSWQYDGKQHADGGYTVTYGDESYTVKAGESATLSTGDKVTAVITKQVKNVSDTKAGNNIITSLIVQNKAQYESIKYEAGTLTITQKPLTITADSDAKVYDGTPLTKNSYTNSALADGDKIESVTITGSITKVGSVDNVASAAVIKAGSEDVMANYDITYVSGKLTISASEKKLTVTANSHSWMYDGQQHADGGYTVTYGSESYTVNAGESATLSTGDKVTAVITKQVKNVSDTAANNNEIVTLTIENADQYTNVEQNAGTLTITKRSVTLTSEDGSKEYDGTPLTKPDVSVTGDGFVDGEVSGIKATGSVTYVSEGMVDNTITYTKGANFKDGNYEITEKVGQLYITKRGSGDAKVIIAAKDNTVKYDGQLHGAVLNVAGQIEENTSFTVANLAAGHKVASVEIDADGGRKYVGTYTNLLVPKNAKIVDQNNKDVTDNYDITYQPGTLTIQKRDAMVTITGPSAERKYTGQEQQITTDAIVYGKNTENGEMNVTGMLEEDNIQVGSVKHVVKGTYVGRYEGTFTFEGAHANDTVPTPTVLNNGYDVTENYNFIYVPGYLTITSEHPTQPDKEIDGHEPGTKYALGDRIYFKITVRNITNAELKNVEVSDPTAVIVAGDGYRVIDEHNALIESMAASTGATPTTVVINAYHVVTEDDIRKAVTEDSFKYENVATITVGDKTIDASKGTNDIEDADYTLKIEKQLINRPASGEKFKLGETAKFQITVTNEGNVTQTDIPVAEKLPGAVFTEGDGYTLNADKTVATITKVLNPADKETQHGDSIILYAQYTITENDLGNTGLKNIVTAPNGKPGEEPIPVDEAKSMAGQKIWNDLDNLYDTRTESVTVNLMRSLGRGGAAELIRTVTVTQNSGWRYSFDHLPAHDMQDNEYFYWVEEEPITGYETVYEMSDDSHCDIVNNLQTYTLTIHYWQHKLGDTKMEQALPDYVATLYYKQPYDVESPEREGIILDDMSQARISGTMPAHDLVIDVYYHRIAYRLTIHYIYQDGTMAHEDYTWTYWFNSTYNVPSPIIPGFTPSIDVIAGRMPSHGLELTVVYVGDGEIVIPDEDTSLGFKSYLNAGECFE